MGRQSVAALLQRCAPTISCSVSVRRPVTRHCRGAARHVGCFRAVVVRQLYGSVGDSATLAESIRPFAPPHRSPVCCSICGARFASAPESLCGSKPTSRAVCQCKPLMTLRLRRTLGTANFIFTLRFRELGAWGAPESAGARVDRAPRLARPGRSLDGVRCL
jgi:hypothetical protein